MRVRNTLIAPPAQAVREDTAYIPAEVASLPKLWTTSGPLTGGTTAAGIIAEWDDLVFGVRKHITVRVLGKAFTAVLTGPVASLAENERFDFARTSARGRTNRQRC